MTETPCTKSELEIFEPSEVQVALSEARWQSYQPLNTLTNADNVEFIIPGTSNEGIDMNNISIYVRGRITLANANNLPEADTVQPSANFLASLFRNVDLSINGQLLTRASREYAYKDTILKMVRYDMPMGGKESTYAKLMGFLPDTPGKHNTMAENTNGQTRATWISESKVFELRGRPCIDLFDSERLLIPGVDMQLKFYLNDPTFYLIGANAATNYKLELQEVELYVRRVTIGDTFVQNISQEIATKDALYPFTRREVLSLSVPQGLTQFTKENLFQGQLAVNFFVALVRNDAFSGVTTRNPFCFEHFNLNEIALYENGQSMSQQPLKVDFGNERTVNAYHLLLEANGAIGERAAYPVISHEAFKQGSTIFCFTRSPDLCMNGAALPNQTGNLTLRLIFSQALAQPITIIILAEFDSRIQINQYKKVITDYAV